MTYVPYRGIPRHYSLCEAIDIVDIRCTCGLSNATLANREKVLAALSKWNPLETETDGLVDDCFKKWRFRE